jgi:CheY-like chemotaxis protein
MINNRKVILIDEDEYDLREMYSQAFFGNGFEVFRVTNGKEALEMLEKRYSDIDIILLDIVAPVLNGLKALEEIRKNKQYSNIPVVIFTNLNNDEDREQSFNLGANGFFVKSKHIPSELVEEINRILSEKTK